MAELVKMPKFKGAIGKTALDFLVDLGEYGEHLRYSEAEFLATIIPLTLRCKARSWWNSRSPFATWDEFQSDFLYFHFPTDCRLQMATEFEERMQGQSERLTTFIYVIDRYFQIIAPHTPGKERVARVIRQAHPNYQQLLIGSEYVLSESLFELHRAALQLQKVVSDILNYKPPPPRWTMVDPSLGWGPYHPNE